MHQVHFSFQRLAFLVAAAMPFVIATPASAQRDGQRNVAPWRQSLSRAARSASFESERTPTVDPSVPQGFSTAGIPTITFAPAKGPRGAIRLAGRITSKEAYPKLGIPAGVSYLWVDASNAVRMAVIPADPTQPAYWFNAVTHASISGSHEKSDELCRSNPTATQLGTRLPPESPQLLMGICTCVHGVWMHSEEDGFQMDAANARVLTGR